MHPSILAKRKAQAMSRILFAAEALAGQLDLDPTWTAGLQPAGVKDLAAAEMIRLEGLADLLTAVALHEGAVKESADEPAVTAALAPYAHLPRTQVPGSTGVTATPVLDTDKPLPEPVLDPDTPEAKPVPRTRAPARRSKK